MFGLDFDFHLLDDFGSLTLGFGVSYAKASGVARNDDNAPLKIPVGLHLIHVRPQLTYIFDPYIETVPLAPYVRVGVVGATYIFTYQGQLDRKGLSNTPPQSPAGIRFGAEVAFGLQFMLDVLEPELAQQARGLGVYDHTYLKAEIAYMPINNFGQPGINLSPQFFGASTLPIVTTFGLVIEFQ